MLKWTQSGRLSLKEAVNLFSKESDEAETNYWDAAIEAGTKISCYSRSNSGAYRGAVVYGIGVDNLEKTMGHSVSTYLKYYRDFNDQKGKTSRFEVAR